MTKIDILNMTTAKEIMKALAEHCELWDEDLSDHLRNAKRKENKARFGDEDIIYRPNKKALEQE